MIGIYLQFSIYSFSFSVDPVGALTYRSRGEAWTLSFDLVCWAASVFSAFIKSLYSWSKSKHAVILQYSAVHYILVNRTITVCSKMHKDGQRRAGANC